MYSSFRTPCRRAAVPQIDALASRLNAFAKAAEALPQALGDVTLVCGTAVAHDQPKIFYTASLVPE